MHTFHELARSKIQSRGYVSMLQEAGELECNACKFFIEEVEKMVEEDKTEVCC